MDAGNAIRKRFRSEKAAIFPGIASLHSQHLTKSNRVSRPGVAHILHSFKRPEEVLEFRETYGPAFFLIGLYSSETERERFLRRRTGSGPRMTSEQASSLMIRDQHESGKWGQEVRDTFHMSDVFVRIDRPEFLDRFLNLFFSNPFETPKIDEYGMFFAHGAAMRSSDLSRQVGAAIVSKDLEILSVGSNEVPKYGGGQYWSGELPARDFERGFDPNTSERRNMASEMIRRIKNLDLVRSSDTRAYFKAISENLSDAKDFDITEFGRVVHAEMEAMISCLRRGLSTRGATLYCTTFPCHVCAKHIIDAGIEEVVFVEPYPKSRATKLHPDSIIVAHEKGKGTKNKVLFRPFLGISPRRYADFFSLRLGSGHELKRKDSKGRTLKWINIGQPRLKLSSMTYMDREALFLADFAV